MLRIILTILFILVSVALAILVLLQEGKSAGLGAISGAVKEAHVIDIDKCIKCGKCITSCKFDAVKKI